MQPTYININKIHILLINRFLHKINNLLLVLFTNMSATTKAWIVVASSIGAVEALKDQLGICRWNYAFRSMQQHVNTRSPYTQAKNLSNSANASNKGKRNKEESMKKVMDLNCWGPPTIRF
ncbi:hypothetical protein MtrunA17_Chr2g0318641 [Medicago truncatula]|uniref:Wound-responsive family protein n=2 Tax=Medicago truncatula TaxID=3880 RepID=A0A396JFR4_MEDTR|nr:hypothetical protein MtrunA17_Chr2g0318641 [Medicago truncatula]